MTKRHRVETAIVLCMLAAGCSSSPTSPTPTGTYPLPPPVTTVPPVVVTPPVVAAPAPVPPTPAPDPRLTDPRFSLAFYRMFALGSLIAPGMDLRRQAVAPRIYLRTVDDAGRPMDPFTLDQTAAALINTAGKLTGVFGLAGLERGTGDHYWQDGWITVSWVRGANGHCGRGHLTGIDLYPDTPGCRCAGGPAVSLVTVKHELGHALGFQHTDSPTDLMWPTMNSCDRNPSEREVFHAGIAYGQPIGSRDPR